MIELERFGAQENYIREQLDVNTTNSKQPNMLRTINAQHKIIPWLAATLARLAKREHFPFSICLKKWKLWNGILQLPFSEMQKKSTNKTRIRQRHTHKQSIRQSKYHCCGTSRVDDARGISIAIAIAWLWHRIVAPTKGASFYYYLTCWKCSQ